MDYGIYVEQLIARRGGARKTFMQIGIVVLAVLLLLILAILPGMLYFVPILVVGIIFISYLLIRHQNVEFEYVLTGTQLDVDMIRARSSRRRIVTVDVKNFESYFPVSESKKELKARCQTIYDCTAGEFPVYGAVFLGVGDAGRCVLLFEPNERMNQALHKVISPRIIKKEE